MRVFYLLISFFWWGSSSVVLSFTPKGARGGNRFFLDTADVDEWDALLPLGIFHGITTNPTLLERAGHKCTIPAVQALAKRALSSHEESWYCQEFMCQAWGSTADEMYDVGMQLSQIDRDRIVIKVPVTMEGTKAAARLIHNGVRVCLTACYDSRQSLTAVGVGAEYLAPYLGRMTETGGKDGMEECKAMQKVANGLGGSTRILVASIRNVKDMQTLAEFGMDTFTFSPEIARAMFDEELTDQAAQDFEEAAKRTQQ